MQQLIADFGTGARVPLPPSPVCCVVLCYADIVATAGVACAYLAPDIWRCWCHYAVTDHWYQMDGYFDGGTAPWLTMGRTDTTKGTEPINQSLACVFVATLFELLHAQFSRQQSEACAAFARGQRDTC